MSTESHTLSQSQQERKEGEHWRRRGKRGSQNNLRPGSLGLELRGSSEIKEPNPLNFAFHFQLNWTKKRSRWLWEGNKFSCFHLRILKGSRRRSWASWLSRLLVSLSPSPVLDPLYSVITGSESDLHRPLSCILRDTSRLFFLCFWISRPLPSQLEMV